MLVNNRRRLRLLPDRDGKSYYIFCEGRRREYNYFLFFKERDSKVNIEPIQLQENEDNSPVGLYNKACDLLVQSENNPDPQYEILEIDEVWFVIDTDVWGDKIPLLRHSCEKHKNWYVAQSNPCFEVWLYYHFFDKKPNFEEMDISKSWKSFVNSCVPGGFDHRRHPKNIDQANQNARNIYQETEDISSLAVTEIYNLGEGIYELVKARLEVER